MKDHDIDIPTLLIFWYPFSSKPSIFIPLNSSVINPVDDDASDTKHLYCFQIVPTEYKKNVNEPADDSVLRTFSAPLKERNQWVHATNVALGIFEKKKMKEKIERIRAQLPPSPPRRASAKFIPRAPMNKQLSPLDESMRAIARLNIDGVPAARTTMPLKGAENINDCYYLMSQNIKHNKHKNMPSKVHWKSPTHLPSNPELSLTCERNRKKDDSSKGNIFDASRLCIRTKENPRSNIEDQQKFDNSIPLRVSSSFSKAAPSLTKVKSFYNQRKDKDIMKVAPNNVTDLSRRVQSLPVRKVGKLKRLE